MPCDGAYATATEYAEWACVDPVTNDSEPIIEDALVKAASRLHAVLAASGQCSCTFASWANEYLKNLNIMIAAIAYNCPCANPSIEEGRLAILAQGLSEELALIRQGKIELCQGETAAEYPDFGIAEQVTTIWTAERIISNTLLRSQ